MKRICIDCRMLNMSGIGTYLKSLLPYLLEKENFGFILLGDKKDLNQFQKRNVEIIEWDAKIYSIKEQISAIGFFKKCDLFWSPHYNIPILCNKKLIVTIHDLFHLDQPQYVNGLAKKLYAKFMFKLIDIKANAIFTVSNFSKERYKYLVNKNKKIIVTYNGVDESWFNNKTEKQNKTPYIIYVGNVKPHKNLKTLLVAFQKLKDKIPHNLIIVGKKEGFITGDNQLEEYVIGIKNRVKFTGFVTDKELREYVGNADALVFPSLYEGFGLPPLEAMAAGCATVVSNAASLPEVCGEASLFFNPHDPDDLSRQLERVIVDRELNQELITKGRAHARSFLWSECANKSIKVLEEVLEIENSYSS